MRNWPCSSLMRCSTRCCKVDGAVAGSALCAPGVAGAAAGGLGGAAGRAAGIWVVPCARPNAGAQSIAATAIGAAFSGSVIAMANPSVVGLIAVIDGWRRRRVVRRRRTVIGRRRAVIGRRGRIAAARGDRGAQAEADDAGGDRRPGGIAVVVALAAVPAAIVPVARLRYRRQTKPEGQNAGNGGNPDAMLHKASPCELPVNACRAPPVP